MLILALFVGLVAIVIGIEDGWTSWRRRLVLYMWGAVVALAAAYVLPIVIGELT